ncbi:hypothetical protein DS843_20610 [Roseomonas genomospecies 6]|uniref:Uncharacterized protein n=1 Tax=Roseomonas genomospecies 6 TaxID=214106 RepID=A0A9W7NEW0_9PROT|nr:hypothetical protein DS843_20610 [Roseomonas genomospecies 6]
MQLARSLRFVPSEYNDAFPDMLEFQRICREDGIIKALNQRNHTRDVFFDNPQTRFILRKYGPLTEDDMEEAWRTIDALDCIGITERFYDSMLAISRIMGIDQRQISEMAVRKINASLAPDEMLRHLGTADIVSTILERTRFDFELYRRAVDRHLRTAGGHAGRTAEPLARAEAPVPQPEDMDLINLFRSTNAQLLDAEAAAYCQLDWDYIRLHPNKPEKPPIMLVSPLFNTHGRRFISGTVQVSHEHGPRILFRVSVLDETGQEVCAIEVPATPGHSADFTMTIPEVAGLVALKLSTRVPDGHGNDYGWGDFIRPRLN